jgi:hypothetical protein
MNLTYVIHQAGIWLQTRHPVTDSEIQQGSVVQSWNTESEVGSAVLFLLWFKMLHLFLPFRYAYISYDR